MAMLPDTLRVLYVGRAIDGETFKACAKSHNWYVYLAETRLQALGTFITYFPDVVVLNATTDPALMEDIYEHIRSVDSTPVVILAVEWATDDEATYVVGPDVPFSILTFIIGASPTSTDVLTGRDQVDHDFAARL